MACGGVWWGKREGGGGEAECGVGCGVGGEEGGERRGRSEEGSGGGGVGKGRGGELLTASCKLQVERERRAQSRK